MPSQRSPLCAVIFASLLLSLHVPAVAYRLAQHDSIIELHPDGHVAANNKESRSIVLSHQNASGVAIGIDITFGHPALSAVANQKFEHEKAEMQGWAKPVSNSSLAMLLESSSKRKDNLTILPRGLGAVAAVHRMATWMARKGKQFSSEISDVAGGGSGGLTIAGVALPAAAVSCTVVASLGAIYGAVNATADFYKNKKRKIAMTKCDTVHKGLSISLAVVGLAATATAIAIPPTAIGMAFLGTSATAASLANRKSLLQRICNTLEKNLTSDIKEMGDLERGLNKFKDEEHDLVGTEVITEDDAADVTPADIDEAVNQAEIVPLEDAVAEGSDSEDEELERLSSADAKAWADSAVVSNENTEPEIISPEDPEVVPDDKTEFNERVGSEREDSIHMEQERPPGADENTSADSDTARFRVWKD